MQDESPKKALQDPNPNPRKRLVPKFEETKESVTTPKKRKAKRRMHL